VTGEIKSDLGSTKCVDDAGSNTTQGNKIDLYSCNSTGAQQWTVEPGGTLKVLGGCISLLDNGNTSGTHVVYAGCSGTAAERWIERSDGALYDPFSSA